MQSPDNKDIMDQVRSTLEEYQPQCSSNDWDKMAALLDRQPKLLKSTRGVHWFNGFICGILVSIIIIGSYYLFINSNSSEKIQITTNLISPSESKSGEIKNKANLAEDSSPNPSLSKKTLNTTNLTSASENISTEIKGETVTKEGNSLNSSSYFNAQSNVNYSNSLKYGENLNTAINQPSNYRQISPNNLSDVSGHSDITSNSIVTIEDRTIQPLDPIWITYLKSAKQTSEEKIFFKQNNSYLHSNRKPAKSKGSMFNWDMFKLSFKMQDDLYKKFIGPDRIKMNYSPEMVFGDFQGKPGISQGFGFLVEGPVSSRISIGLGLYQRQYDWQKEKTFRSLQKGVLPDTSMQYIIDSIHINKGRWKYFEIPLELSLHFIQNGKTQIGLNTSISAIIMQSEKYQFDRIIGQTTLSQKQIPSPFSNYSIFGSLKIGLEYRYRIGERLNMFVEPYFKWYLKGMGETNYKPRSFGINIGVVYQFNLHRKN